MTREEAIDVVKERLDYHESEKRLRAACEFLIPELAESEDERIRKGLIKLLTVASEAYLVDSTGIKKDSYLAYLEKQKEHPNGCFTCDEYKKGYEAGRLNGFTAGYNKAMKEIEQKEQKSAEWSEEDEEMLNSCISSIEEAKENRYAYKETDGDTSYDHEISWLRSLRPQPRWKPSDK